MNELKVYLQHIRMNFLSGLQYKGWPIMVFQVIFVVISDPIGLFLLFSRFGSIGEWSVDRIALIYAMAVTSFGLAETFFRGFDYFPWKMIQTGDFDRVLLRPRSSVTLVAASYFHIHRISRVFGGGCFIVWALIKQGFRPTLLNVLTIIQGLAGGLCMYAGVFIMTSGIAFFTVKALDWIFIFTNASYQVTRCPINHMPRVLRHMFTFFMPVLVVSYYPASAACGWGDGYAMAFLALPAGLLFLLFSLLVWKLGVRHYTSTGS